MSRSVLIVTIRYVRLFLTMVSICAIGILGYGQEVATSVIDQSTAARVKAVYLYQFGQLTKWPDAASSSKSEFTIGVVDSALVHDNLLQIAAKRKTIQDKQIKIKNYTSAKQVKPGECEVLFFPSTVSPSDIAEAAKALSELPVITVTESIVHPTNSIVNFLIEGEGIHFEINNEEAQRKELAMDARLLRQGRIMQNK